MRNVLVQDDQPMEINVEEYDGRLSLTPEDVSEEVIEDPTVLQKDDDHVLLSPRQAYPRPESLDNFFICKICLKVLNDPKECSQCQTAFCTECLNQWI